MYFTSTPKPVKTSDKATPRTISRRNNYLASQFASVSRVNDSALSVQTSKLLKSFDQTNRKERYFGASWACSSWNWRWKNGGNESWFGNSLGKAQNYGKVLMTYFLNAIFLKGISLDFESSGQTKIYLSPLSPPPAVVVVFTFSNINIELKKILSL